MCSNFIFNNLPFKVKNIMIHQLKTILKERQDALQVREVKQKLRLEDLEKKETRISECKTLLDTAKESIQVIEDIANSRRETVRKNVEAVASEALHLIYGPEYKMELVYKVRHNRANVEIEVVKDTPDGEIRREMDGFGGGVADTVAMPLKLLVLIASGRTDKILLCDEAWKHIDTDRIHKVGEFIESLCKRLQMQVVVLSHHEIMMDYADNVYQITNPTKHLAVVKKVI